MAFLRDIFRHHRGSAVSAEDSRRWVIPYCLCMHVHVQSKTGALIVIEQSIPLELYEKTGDMIDAEINSRLIENAFFLKIPCMMVL